MPPGRAFQRPDNLQSQRCGFSSLLLSKNNIGQVVKLIKVPMKRKLSLGSYKIYPFKHGISKFEIAEVKIADFVSAQSWAILPSKMVFELRGQNTR